MSRQWKALLLPGALVFCLGVLSCSSNNAGNTANGNPADFSISAAPATATLTAGSAAQAINITATALNGFTGTVNVSATGLPTGVTATPTMLALTPGVSQIISLTASSNAAAATQAVTLTAVSGALTHTAQVNLTVVKTPTFSLQVTPQSLNLAPGSAGQSATVTALAANGFTSTVNLSLGSLPTGVTASPTTLALVPGAGQQIIFTAAAGAPASNATITMQGVSAGSSPITQTASLSLAVSSPGASNDVTTYHNDVARTGQNLQETVLTPSNVNSISFGLLKFLPADGHVDAEPLYLQKLLVGSQSHNVVYVASEHDSVYAFDADTGAQLWTASLLGAGETTSDDHSCSQISPEIGITSTPVIDRYYGSHGAIFLVAMSKDSAGNYHQRLHALDITTGAELAGSPTEIQATYPGTGANSTNGSVVFDPGQYAERVGLLLLNGTLYLGWTSHCDIQPYTGWLMGYSEATLKQTSVLNLTPNGAEGSIWMSGAGLAADAAGNIFFLDANGTFDTTLTANGFPSEGDFGNSFMKVSTSGGTLTAADYFAIDNTVSESGGDVDLGSGGALVLPDVKDSSGQVHQLAVGAGKDTNIYVVDRNNMGKFNAANNNAVYQELAGALPGGEWAMPAYFNNTVYYGGVGDFIKAFPITNAKLATAPAALTANTFTYPGATPSISANGTTNGIVWAVQNTATATLYAFNATNLQELYDSNQAPNGRDNFGAGNKFITPMIANGKVFVGAPNGIGVFGLLP